MSLKDIALKELASWALYSKDHKVEARDISGGVWLGYRTTSANRSHWRATTHFDVNVVGEVFFVLEICVEPHQRGKGHGNTLYKILEAIAKEAGCSRVQMMPSGWTASGETRKDYLLRRGYTEFGNEVIKKVA